MRTKVCRMLCILADLNLKRKVVLTLNQNTPPTLVDGGDTVSTEVISGEYQRIEKVGQGGPQSYQGDLHKM